MDEILFDQHDGYWIGYKDNLILWLPPVEAYGSEEIDNTVHFVSDLDENVGGVQKGYTFVDLRNEHDFQVLMTLNEAREVVAWFASPSKDIAYALKLDGSDVGAWAEHPRTKVEVSNGTE